MNSTQLRDDAYALTKQAQDALDSGNIEQAQKLSSDAEAQVKKADEYDSALARISHLTADARDLESTRVDVTPSVQEAQLIEEEKSIKGARLDNNYKPQNYVKSLPAAAQTKQVIEMCGENVQDASKAYVDAFRFWTKCRTEDEFRSRAPEHMKATMTEGTDADGGYYVPEEFIARNVELWKGNVGGNIRDYCTPVRVSSKDGYAPATSALSWAALTEATAPTAVKPTVSQIAFTLEKSGSLVQVSDELLEDEAISVPDVLAAAARKAAGQYQNVQLLNGTGAWKGVLQAASGTIGSHTTAAAAAIAASDITGWFYDIDADFRNSENAVFLTTSPVAAVIAAIGSASAGINAQASLTEAPSAFLMGKPYVQDDNSGNGLATAVATTNVTGIWGSWDDVYLWERQGFSISRDVSRYWDAGLVGYKFTYRMGSTMGNASAFSKLVQA